MTERKLGVPPYQLYTLIPTAVPFGDTEQASGGRRRTVSGVGKATITAVQAFGPNIYLGCSDGQVLRYTLEDNGDGVGTYQLASTRTLPGDQPILSMQLAVSIAKLLVHIDQFLYFLSIPTLDLVSSELIRPMKNVLGFAINETPNPGEAIGLSIVKRTSIAFWDLTSRLLFVKEINISSVIAVKRAGSNICIADTDQYSILDTKATNVLPFYPISLDPVMKVLPQMSVAGRDEYFCVTYNVPSSIGTFIDSAGDPCRSPITEWIGHPASVCIDDDLLISSMPNRQVQVYNINTQNLSQTVKFPSSMPAPPTLALSRPGFSAPINQRKRTLQRLPITVPPTSVPKLPSPITRRDPTEPNGSGLTPPPTPIRPATSAARAPGGANLQPLQFPKARVIVFGPDCVYALLPSTIISQADGLIDSGKAQDAAYLVAQAQKKLSTRPGGEGDMADDIRYIHQRIGLTYLRETAFEEAGDSLFRGDTDPRLLIRLFPEFHRPGLTDDFTLDVFAALESQLRSLLNCTISEIVSRNIVRNYAPHLKATTGEELETTLQWGAQQMLGKYLRKFRNRRQFISHTKIGEMYSDPVVNRAVDTVLVELLAASTDRDDAEDLRSLLDESTHLVLEEVESTLVQRSQFNALASMYEKKGNHAKLLELLVKVADGEWRDPTIEEPVARITTMLQDLKDRTLVERHALWLLKRDPHTGLKILTSIRESKRSSKDSDIALLQQIRQVDAFAGHGFLEHLVMEKQSTDSGLHTQLAMSFLDQLQEYLGDPTIAAFYRQINRDYPQRHTTTPFLAYLAFGSQDVDHKRTRLKFALFLQGSSSYDSTQLRERLLQHRQILNIELAIVDGKLDLHKEALSILVNDLQDSTTAEAYCSLGGQVIPSKIATAIGDELELGVWASLIVGKGRLQRTLTGGSNLAPPSEEKKKQMLTKMLVEVYISSGRGKAEHAAKVLNAQAINLEVGEVLSMVPPEWSLNLIASFLSRSFRRTLHDRYESQILKQLSAGQNLQTSEFAFETFAAAGAVIEEAAPGQDPGGHTVGEDEYHQSQQAAEMPEGEEGPVILSNGEKEKALPPLDVTQDHMVSTAKEDTAKEIIVSPTLSPTRPDIDVS